MEKIDNVQHNQWSINQTKFGALMHAMFPCLPSALFSLKYLPACGSIFELKVVFVLQKQKLWKI